MFTQTYGLFVVGVIVTGLALKNIIKREVLR